MEHLHDSADDPFEVVMTRLDIVPLEPTRARERMTVSVEGVVFAGPNPAPHVLGASRTFDSYRLSVMCDVNTNM